MIHVGGMSTLGNVQYILAFFQESFSEGKYIVMQSFIVIQIFLLFLDQNSGGAKVSEGVKLLQGHSLSSPRGRKPASEGYYEYIGGIP